MDLRAYTVKEGHNGKLSYEAGSFANGYSQSAGVDYFDIFSPKSKITPFMYYFSLLLT